MVELETDMKIDFDTVLRRAEELYTEEKLGLHPTPGETLEIQSDQVKCVLKALVEAINQTSP